MHNRITITSENSLRTLGRRTSARLILILLHFPPLFHFLTFPILLLQPFTSAVLLSFLFSFSLPLFYILPLLPAYFGSLVIRRLPLVVNRHVRESSFSRSKARDGSHFANRSGHRHRHTTHHFFFVSVAADCIPPRCVAPQCASRDCLIMLHCLHMAWSCNMHACRRRSAVINVTMLPTAALSELLSLSLSLFMVAST